MAKFKILVLHLPGGTEEIHKDPWTAGLEAKIWIGHHLNIKQTG